MAQHSDGTREQGRQRECEIYHHPNTRGAAFCSGAGAYGKGAEACGTGRDGEG